MCPINLRALSMYTNTNKLLMRIFTQILTWYSPFQRLFKTVEYNFVVHPKGKISDIQLKFSRAKTELIEIKIHTATLWCHGRNASF
jgi:exoribonuclease II